MRTCPFTGCKTTVSAEVFACRKHWFTMNPAEQERLNWALRQHADGTMTMAELIQFQQSVLGDRGRA